MILKRWNNMTNKTRILFIPNKSFFAPVMKDDLKILKKYYDVEVVSNFDLTKLFFKDKVLKKLLQSDVLFVRFANKQNFYLVLLAKLLRKKSIVVGGGYDAVKMPEINYGLSLSLQGEFIAKGTFFLADKILAFSDSSKKSIQDLVSKARVETVYIGSIDCEAFRPKGEKKNLVITVGHVKWNNLKRKGLETFVKAARLLPDEQFVLIGEHKDDSINYLKSIATSNIKFLGFLPFDQMLDYLQKAKVYVQVSAHEGFGISLANAMACECIPVVTKRYALPEVVGDTGFYVPYDDVKATANAIKKALKASEEFGKKARIRINNNFPLGRREKELKMIIDELI
jgi:glycosyltransferase involved in cell wall biosynthesis